MNNKHYVLLARLMVLALAVSFALPGSVFGQAYEGAEFCKDCHEDNYNEWRKSGHPYKLTKGQIAKHRPIPLPRGSDWPEGDTLVGDDVSYTIGGYKWKVRFVDKDGYIITVTEDENGQPVDGVNQWNYLVGYWSNYHAGEVQKPYNCGKCHTTNWVPDEDWETDGTLEDNQDGLPGMHGTFDAGGIHCEQCHGNGLTMAVDTSADACGACHYRTSAPGDVNSIPASGGWIKHHEQYNEHKASPHANMDCVSCHDPHKRGEYSIKDGRECSDCHTTQATAYEGSIMDDYDVTCIDCHMAFATKSAQPLGPYQGDVWTHLFAINTDADANLFTEDGSFVALDDEGQASVTLDFACKRCHGETEMAELARFAKNFHGTEMAEPASIAKYSNGVETDGFLPELHYVGITPGNSGHYWSGASRDGEGFLIDVSYRSNGRILIVVSFYTYDPAGNQTWLVGAKTIDRGENVATINLSIPSGAKWGPDFDPMDLPSPRQAWGTMELMMETCGTASVIATPNAEMQGLGYVEHSFDVTRDLSVSGIQCPSMLNNPAILAAE